MSSASSTPTALWTPWRRSTSSNTCEEPASAAVWVEAASPPISERPILHSTTGRRRSQARSSAAMNFWPSPTPSRQPTTTFASPVSASQARQSAKSMSAWLPVDPQKS